MVRVAMLDHQIVDLGPSGTRGRPEMAGFAVLPSPLTVTAPARLADKMG